MPRVFRWSKGTKTLGTRVQMEAPPFGAKISVLAYLSADIISICSRSESFPRVALGKLLALKMTVE